MRVREIIWPQDRTDHVAGHGIKPEEVDDVCFGRAMIQRARAEGDNPVYYVLGQTEAGRFLLCVIIQFPDGKGYPVTARPMTERESRRYRQWMKQ